MASNATGRLNFKTAPNPDSHLSADMAFLTRTARSLNEGQRPIDGEMSAAQLPIPTQRARLLATLRGSMLYQLQEIGLEARSLLALIAQLDRCLLPLPSRADVIIT